jgi:hypothetical protein
MLFKFNTGDPFLVPEPSAAGLMLLAGGLVLRRRRP